MPNVYQLIPRNITDTSVDIQVISYTSPSTTISNITIGVHKSGETVGATQTLSDPGTNYGQVVGTLTFNSLSPRTQYSTTITGGTAISLITFKTLASPDTPRTATQAQWEDLASRVDSANNKIKSNAGAPTTTTVGTKGMLLEDTTNGKLYQCTAIDTTDPDNPSYTWSEVGAGGSGPTITMTSTDPGEGSALAANNFVAVYGGDPIIEDYSTLEVNTGTKWIDGSPIYKKTIDTGALPDTGPKNVSHSISNLGTVINLEGYATNGSVWLNLPAAASSPITAHATSTDIHITTTSDRSSYTESYVTLYYTKSS